MRQARSSRSRSRPDIFSNRVLVCDGAMGTMLQAAGVSLDRSLPELSVSRPELVSAIHGAYIAAGSQIIETNTFGACRTRLDRYGLADRVIEINNAGARAARTAVVNSGRDVLVAGSVGPATLPGARGRLAHSLLRETFREQVQALSDGGVDFILFETFGALDELLEAVAAAREVSKSLPLVAQMTFLEDACTLAGETPAEVAERLDGLGLAALGANCTLGPQGLLDVLRELAHHTSLPLIAQPNAGSPTFVDGRFQYTADPAYFARYAGRYAQLGAAIIGGCCGTTPEHIEAVSASVMEIRPQATSKARRATGARDAASDAASAPGPSQLMTGLQSGRFVVLGELTPPSGGAADQAVRDAALLKEAGCDAILIAPPSSPRAQVSPTSLAVLVQQRVPELEAVLTVATWEKSAMSLQADLLGAYAFGVRHVVCRTGVPPLVGDYPNTGGFWDVDSVELLQLLAGLNQGVDRHGIPLAQPTAFVVGARINPSAEDREREVEDARRKIDAGVDFLVTPPVFDAAALEGLIDEIGLPDDLPVLMGVMPLRDFRHAEYLQHEVPGVLLPEEMLQRMYHAGEEGASVGLQVARELIARAQASSHIRGVVLSASSNSVEELTRLLREVTR